MSLDPSYTVPGPPAQILAAILGGGSGAASTATFSGTNFPDLPSLMTEVVWLPQFAQLNADVQVLGTLISQGWATGNVTAVTAAYTALSTDAVILADATAAAFTVTLPDATQPGFTVGQRYTVIKTDASANAVTVAGSLSQKINGASTVTLSGTNAYTGVVFDGANWWVWTGYTLTGLASPLPISQGGTGQVTAALAFNALSPMTTLGDLTYESGANTAARLAGNTTTSKRFLTQTGTGSVSAAPGWNPIASGDLPAATTALQGAVLLPAASASFKPSNPTGTTSLTEVMMGVGSTVAYTPSGSGKVTLTVNGVVCAPTASVGATIGGRYGTGTAPINGAAVSGTTWGVDSQVRIANVSTTVGVSFGLNDRLSLTAGTTYWFDLALATGTASDTVQLVYLQFTVAEQLN